MELSELDVSLLRLLAQGRTVKSVRRQLDPSERTVRRHLILMAENLDAGRSTIEVVIAAVRAGLV